MNKKDYKFKHEVIESIFYKRLKKKLSIGFSNASGRNVYGRITVLRKGGRVKSKLRLLDWRRVISSKGKVISIEKDWIRTGYVGCICYNIGLISYVLLPENIKIDQDWEGFSLMKNKGISSFIGNLEVGSIVHNIESAPGKGITLLRAAGNSGVLVHKSSKFGVIKLSSGILQKVSLTCVGVRNMVSNSVHRFLSIKKAGSARLLGRRPTVRGVAMNPVDHPHGGGEGKKSQLALPKTPWGKPGKWKKKKKKIKLINIHAREYMVLNVKCNFYE